MAAAALTRAAMAQKGGASSTLAATPASAAAQGPAPTGWAAAIYKAIQQQKAKKGADQLAEDKRTGRTAALTDAQRRLVAGGAARSTLG